MTQEQKRRDRREAPEEAAQDLPEKEIDHVDPAVTEALLDEIDAVLKEQEWERFKEKLRGIQFKGRRHVTGDREDFMTLVAEATVGPCGLCD